MVRGGYFLKFQWRDPLGKTWTVRFAGDSMGFSGFAASRQIPHAGLIHVQTHALGSRHPLAVAHLVDIQVNPRLENRGLGSMLVRKVIEECKRRGHKGVDGSLSDVDRDHFPKLKHFYEKLGFSVLISSEDQPSKRSRWAGKIEMVFDDAQVES